MFPNGEFVYFGLEDGIKKNLHFDIFSISTIKLDINVDGIPVFKSLNTSFWPILCSLNNSIENSIRNSNPFVVALLAFFMVKIRLTLIDTCRNLSTSLNFSWKMA